MNEPHTAVTAVAAVCVVVRVCGSVVCGGVVVLGVVCVFCVCARGKERQERNSERPTSPESARKRVV